ncbi:GGDEF domain-containing protein [Vibrio furnissii]|uniref:GGDEF domain-containing protein n=1 Tax=Vibrio furnissii TaxID=29494 RepID=UPI001302514D|nr:GGDEF domain-containing protein [Vibrio furnissii]MCG6211174.1 GGDEF domain-containing protein [Vibrio furnissii]
MIARLINQNLQLTHDDEQYRRIYLNCASALLLAANNVFFLFYNTVIDFYPPLIYAHLVTFAVVCLSQYLLFVKRKTRTSALLLTCVIALLTHFYMFDEGNREYALIFGLITPVVAIALLPRKISLPFIAIQFAVFNGLILSNMQTWQPVEDNVASYINLVVVWITLALIIWYFEASRLHAYRKMNEANLKLEKLAMTDSLTGVFNRHYIERRIAHSTRPFHVAMIDVDNFKLVNDQFGHVAGDGVLKGIADVLKQSFANIGIVGRWGGEEFIVLLTEGSDEDIYRLTEQARAKVAATPFGIQVPVSISIGLAHHDLGDYEATLRKVDKALYSAKSEGKNRIVSMLQYEDIQHQDIQHKSIPREEMEHNGVPHQG